MAGKHLTKYMKKALRKGMGPVTKGTYRKAKRASKELPSIIGAGLEAKTNIAARGVSDTFTRLPSPSAARATGIQTDPLRGAGLGAAKDSALKSSVNDTFSRMTAPTNAKDIGNNIRGHALNSHQGAPGRAGWGEFFKRAGKGIVDETLSPEGLDRWAGNAMTGAAWFAGVGGVREMADGGSFWEGAGRGAVSGALWGTAATAMGSAARGFNPEASGFQGTRQELSKQLSAVMRNKRDVASAATNVVNNRG